MRLRFAGLLLIVWVTTAVSSVEAQGGAATILVPRPLVVVARRDLSFGTVVRGITLAVPTHAAAAGLFEIQGEPNAAIRVDFILPTAMISGGGDVLQLVFGPGDGATTGGIARMIAVGFDPRHPLITTLGPTGQLQIQLGGTALPSRQQPGGIYHARVSLTVSDLGS